MLHQTDNLTITDLLKQIAEWSLRNFKDRQASDLGVVEEIGEACHGILKRYQGIRGFDVDKHYEDHMADCFADMGIYMLNYAGTNGILIHHHELQSLPLGVNDRRCVTQLLMGVSLLVEFTDINSAMLTSEQVAEKEQLQAILQKLWDWTNIWATMQGFAFRSIVTETWLKVRQRDWEKNRTHAHIVAEQGGTEVPIPAVPDANAAGMTPLDIGSASPEPGAVTSTELPHAGQAFSKQDVESGGMF